MTLTEELLSAVKANDVDRVSELLAQDANLVHTKAGDDSALLTAAYYGATDVIPVLLRHGADVSFFEAAAIGQTETVVRFLEAQPEQLNRYSHDGFTALGLASFFGHADIVSELLRHGADVNAVSKNAMQVAALHSAVAHQHTGIAAMLLSHGANVNLKQQAGFTPLLEAVHNQQLDMVDLLLAHGADAGIANDDGETPRQMASVSGNSELNALLTLATKP